MSLVEGPIFQVCWVVADIDAAVTYFREHLGVSRWMRIPDVKFGRGRGSLRGEPADYVIHVAIGYAGAQQVELIQPVSGRSLYSEHLEGYGPGLHHVAWVPADFDAAVAEAANRSLAIPQRGAMPDVDLEFAYLDGGPLGSHIELMGLGPQMRAIFDSLAGGER